MYWLVSSVTVAVGRGVQEPAIGGSIGLLGAKRGEGVGVVGEGLERVGGGGGLVGEVGKRERLREGEREGRRKE